jgi:uncharacterized SAM-binding protein YcdF (DUF218 family)
MNGTHNSSPNQLSPNSNLLVVLGESVGVYSATDKTLEQPDYLGDDARLNAIAAGALYSPGSNMKILFSGRRAEGQDIPAEPEAMRAYMLTHFPAIPNTAINLDNHSPSTTGSARKVKKILANHEERYQEEGKHLRVGLVVAKRYLPQAVHIFESEGVPIKAHIASEEIVGRYLGQQTYVEQWARSRRVEA